MAFNWEIESTFDSTKKTDKTEQPALTLNLPLFKALHVHGNARKTPGYWLPPTQWFDLQSGLFCSCARRDRLKVKAGWSVLSNVDVIE